MKIKSISLKGFRGSTQNATVIFDTTKRLSLIFGENGTGKSTIIDGFDFLCNQNYGSLLNYSIGKSAKSYLPSHGKKASECCVELASDGESWEAILSGSTIKITPNVNVPDARILRRPAILRLIEQQPKDRFNELKSFISVPNTERTESAFRDAIKETNRLFNEYTRSLSQAKDALEELWEGAGRQGKSAIEWAKKISESDTEEEQKSVEIIGKTINQVSDVLSTSTSLIRARENEKISIDAENTAKQKQQVFEVNQKERDSELLQLLQKSHGYLTKHSTIEKCPVCETEQDVVELSKKIAARIKEMDEIQILSTATQQATSQVEAKKTLRIDAEKTFFEKHQEFIKFLKNLPEEIRNVISIDEKFIDEGLSNTNFSNELFEHFMKWHSSFYEVIEKKKLEEIKTKYQTSITLKSAIHSHLKIVEEKELLAKSKEGLLHELTNILEIIEKERKEYIEHILQAISQEVSTLYASLHPDEELGEARFYLKPNAIASLEFDASFQSAKEIPPQAYYSESHLDTLGICVFIALSKYYKTDNTILILDDVLTSVDAQHMDRFMKLLYEQSKNFNQIIVTTHYRPWKERYKYTRSAVANIDVIELGPWTLQTGIQVSQFKEAIKELKELIKDGAFDRQVAASKAGIILESVLDFITLKYCCSLPRNGRNEYTLGELVNGIDSKLSKLLKVKKDGKDIELKSLLDATISAQWIRNCVGCHFNLTGSSVTDTEVKNFALSVINIVDIIICPNCNNLPKKNSGSYWQCSCPDNHLEMHPLTQPGATTRDIGDDE